MRKIPRKTKVICALGLFFLWVPIGFGAENTIVDSSSGSGAQKNSLGTALGSSADLLSRPVLISSAHGQLGGEALPTLISMSKPILYPGWARRKGSEGLLIVALEILENGSVGRWQIIRSTGEESLDKAAVKAFLTWKFQPAIKNGRPVKTCIQLPINFELMEE
ncbi:MAG: energy transducer TonB [Candidatus Omnitrophota bacterium]